MTSGGAEVPPHRQDLVRPVDEDEAEAAEGFEPPGADLSGAELSGAELTVRVLPRQQDGFTCASCFLVKHRSRLHDSSDIGAGQLVCNDCAA
ncbi:DUF4193 family protein [Kineococcus sp. T13]|nr:DUF4193 family protein [Kineococcus vitellinus]